MLNNSCGLWLGNIISVKLENEQAEAVVKLQGSLSEAASGDHLKKLIITFQK